MRLGGSICSALALSVTSLLALPSRAEEPPATPASAVASSSAAATSLLVVYVETELREPSLATATEPDADLVAWRVPETGRMLRERVPLVLAANGMTGTVVTVKAPADPAALVASEGPRPLLLIGVSKYTKSGLALRRAGSVVFSARFFDHGPPEPPRWAEGIGFSLGFDPIWGILKIQRVDEQMVDSLLVIILDSLARQGLVKLPGPKAARPKA